MSIHFATSAGPTAECMCGSCFRTAGHELALTSSTLVFVQSFASSYTFACRSLIVQMMCWMIIFDDGRWQFFFLQTADFSFFSKFRTLVCAFLARISHYRRNCCLKSSKITNFKFSTTCSLKWFFDSMSRPCSILNANF